MDWSVAWLTVSPSRAFARCVAPYAAVARMREVLDGPFGQLQGLRTSESEVHTACHNEFLASSAFAHHDRRVGTRRPTPGHPALDDVSKAIIEQLQEDGRRPYATIGKAIGLSEAAVRQRVQRLIDSGVMQIVAVTDPLQVGFTRQAMIGLRADGRPRASSPTRSPTCDEVDYVVITAGGVRPAVRGGLRGRRPPARGAQPEDPHDPRVRTTETFVYLKLRKQLYNWGTR